jgi:lipopolysaccharide/colanic/teichoic acid biosynthesis glycosyltransferase
MWFKNVKTKNLQPGMIHLSQVNTDRDFIIIDVSDINDTFFYETRLYNNSSQVFKVVRQADEVLSVVDFESP